MMKNITIIAGYLMIMHAGFSIIQYRRYVTIQLDNKLPGGDSHSGQDSLKIELPIDVFIEIYIGLIMGVVGTIWKFSEEFDSIRNIEVLGMETKSYEMALNINRVNSLRNL